MPLGTVQTPQGKVAVDWLDRFCDPVSGRVYIVACASHKRGLGELPWAGTGPWKMWPESAVDLGDLTIAKGRSGHPCAGCAARFRSLISRAIVVVAARRIGTLQLRAEQGFTDPAGTSVRVPAGHYALTLDMTSREVRAQLPGTVMSIGAGRHERVGERIPYHWRVSESALARMVGEHLNTERYLILLEPGVKVRRVTLEGSDGHGHPAWRLSLPKI